MNEIDFVAEQIRGWLGNLARNESAEGRVLEPETVLQALSDVMMEYDQLIEEPDFNGFLESLNEDEDGRGTE